MNIFRRLLSFFRKPPPAPPTPWRVETDAFGNIYVQKGTESRRFVTYPYGYWFSDNSTPQHYWDHPEGHPFQVYGGPLLLDADRFEKQVWTNIPELDGYALVMDDYSDRIYLVWMGGDHPVFGP